jgi:hypothetical protein
MDRTERFYKIDHLLRANKCVPQKRFLQELEVSRATFKRDIEYMRSRLHAPIAWDRQGHGYCFTKPARGAPAYEPPMPGYGPRGGDIDRNGVYWVSLSSGHLGKFVILRVPYPMGFFAKWGEGRIDDPNGGWKGRSLWATNSTRTQFHNEGGKANRPNVVRFQMRPDPLAR